MNALAETIKNIYKLQIHRGTGKSYGFCVGGAACHYLADQVDWGEIHSCESEITEGMKKFPHEDELTMALAQIASTDDYSDVRFYSSSIVTYNDEGDFSNSWDALGDFFDDYELSECGECGELKQGDARSSGGMRCGVCAYG